MTLYSGSVTFRWFASDYLCKLGVLIDHFRKQQIAEPLLSQKGFLEEMPSEEGENPYSVLGDICSVQGGLGLDVSQFGCSLSW